MRRLALLLLCGCFDPRLSQTPFACGPQGQCPPGYACVGGQCVAGATTIDAPPGPDARVDARVGVIDARPPDATMPDAGCTPIQLLGNPGFDSTTGPFNNRNIAPWEQSPAFPPLVLDEQELAMGGVTPDTPRYAAALARLNSADDMLFQTLTVPERTGRLRLEGRLWVISQEPTGNPPFDFLFIDLVDPNNGDVIDRLATATDDSVSNGWQSFSVLSLAPHPGETLMLRLRAQTGNILPTTFLVDTLALVTTCP